jgi:predicted Ser/Thr protein kinase
VDEQLKRALRVWLADDALREQGLLSSGYQGSAYLFAGDVAGKTAKYVLKRAAAGLLTGWFHRLMLQREARVYELLAHVEGVPHSPGLLDNTWLVLEFIDGQSLKEARYALNDEQLFYARLHEIIMAFHTAGVAHGDLKRKDNVLVKAGELPVVIDFGTAVMREGGMVDRLLFKLVRRLDHNAWIKVKYRHDYAAISAEDLRWYRPSILERGFRQLQRFWRAVSLRQMRKRWRRQQAADRHKSQD